MKTVLFAAALFLAAAVPVVAAPASTTDDACLMHRYVDGWGSHGDHAMIVNDRFGRKYLLSLAGYCSDLDFSMAVGIRSPVGGGYSCVERGDKIVMRGGGVMSGPSACWITKIERYTPEMEKAYKEAQEAKKNPPAN
jgi:hypothetical protein